MIGTKGRVVWWWGVGVVGLDFPKGGLGVDPVWRHIACNSHHGKKKKSRIGT